MAEYEISLNSDQVKGLLTSDEGLKGLVEAVAGEKGSEPFYARGGVLCFASSVGG